jgi:hypothetical protein
VYEPVRESGDHNSGAAGANEEDVSGVDDLAHRRAQLLAVRIGGVSGELIEDRPQVGGDAHRGAPWTISCGYAASVATSAARVIPLPTMIM